MIKNLYRVAQSFQSRIILSILIIAGFTGALGLTFVYLIGKNIIEKNIGHEFQKTAEETSKNLTRLFEYYIDEASWLGTASDVLEIIHQSNRLQGARLPPGKTLEEGDRTRMIGELLQSPASRYIQQLRGRLGRLHEELGTVVLDRTGRVVAATAEPGELYFGDQPWWGPMMEASQGKHYISDIEYKDSFKNIPPGYTLSIAVPIYDPGQPKPIGAILMIQSVKAFFDLVTGVKIANTDHTMLAGSDGNLLFCPIFLVKNHTLQPDLIKEITRGLPGWGMTQVDVHYSGSKSINGFAPFTMKNAIHGSFGGNRWYIFTSQDPKETYAPIRTLLGWVAGSGALGIGFLAFFSFYATGRLVKPIKELQKGAEEIALGNLHQTLNIQTGDEIEALASAFNEMALKIKESYDHLEQKVAQRTRDLEGRNKELSSLYIIASILNKSLNLKELLDEALSATLKIFETEAGVIHVLDPDGTSLVPVASRGFSAEIQDVAFRKKDEQTLLSQVIQKGMSLSFSSGEDLFQETPFPYFITIPIRSKGNVSGAISLLDRSTTPFLHQDLQLLAAIGNQIGVAIENARLYEETKKVDQLKTDFVSKVSHEFRTPLTSIKGFIEILLSYDDISEEKRKEFLHIINQESDRLIRLINDVLDISKIEAGKVEWKIEPLHLSDLILSVVQAVQSLADSKKLRLRVEIAPDLPMVIGDQDQLTQVFNNLLSNAIKFTKRGEITVFARPYGAGEVVAGVQDTGMGLPPSERTKIFTKFYQISRPEKGVPKGTGLGLAICREIIQHLGGTIWCDSVPGEGSTFSFTLSVASDGK